MYRASDSSFAQTIETLERELAEMRGLAGSPRRRLKWLGALTALSIVSSILLGAACAAAHERAERLQRHMAEAAQLLDAREHDLRTVTSLAADQERAAQQCKVEWLQLESQVLTPQAALR